MTNIYVGRKSPVFKSRRLFSPISKISYSWEQPWNLNIYLRWLRRNWSHPHLTLDQKNCMAFYIGTWSLSDLSLQDGELNSCYKNFKYLTNYLTIVCSCSKVTSSWWGNFMTLSGNSFETYLNIFNKLGCWWSFWGAKHM